MMLPEAAAAPLLGGRTSYFLRILSTTLFLFFSPLLFSAHFPHPRFSRQSNGGREGERSKENAGWRILMALITLVGGFLIYFLYFSSVGKSGA